MTETLKIIETSSLPIQLKEYFSGSKKIQKLITAKLIEDIEDLYLYYDSLYYFELSEFGVYVIDSLLKCRDFSSYYFYLKKILGNHLEVESRDENYIVRLKKNIITDIYTKSATEIFKLLSSKSDEKMNQINFHIGKLVSINELIEDEDYIEIYEKIIQLKNNYDRERDILSDSLS